ncbi:hypothetical protein DDT91_12165 [Algoriphagus sp. AK58]|nr:hypothetical protein [Algoriphagus sp. AK58]
MEQSKNKDPFENQTNEPPRSDLGWFFCDNTFPKLKGLRLTRFKRSFKALFSTNDRFILEAKRVSVRAESRILQFRNSRLSSAHGDYNPAFWVNYRNLSFLNPNFSNCKVGNVAKGRQIKTLPKC